VNRILSQQLYPKTINPTLSPFQPYQQSPFKHYPSHPLTLNQPTKYQLQNFHLPHIFHSLLKYISHPIYAHFNNLHTNNIQSLTKQPLQ
ncbi:hypothetical protein, partial [Staphylococcus epidermidis]|uniref:hypothetical protein n=1 Tax=Staphylococcus epidermidis TaxID=1282 RepID=UPI0021B37694